jgi:hypothetical protein
MSHEYVAAVTPPVGAATVIAGAVARDARYVVLPTSAPDHVRVRIAAHPPGETWDEDVTIYLQDHHVLVAFHRATQDERDGLLAVVERVLASLGAPARFAES